MEPQTADLGNGYTKQVNYYDSGKVEDEAYYLNGESHHEDGPAVIRYYESGEIENKSWYLDDKCLTEDKFEQRMIVKKLGLV